MKLRRPMSSHLTPSWTGAKWVGEIDYEDFQDPASGELSSIFLEEGGEYASASLLVRYHHTVMGFIDVPVHNSFLMRGEVAEAIHNLPVPTAPQTLTAHPSVTVVICTHNRADQLAEALTSVMHLDYPNFNVLVVENAPTNQDTARLLANQYPNVEYAVQPIKGLSHARNTALKLATGEFIAFTDDDVVVDPYWLQSLVATFEENPDIACVTGLVPSGEFASPTQAYFDQRVTWSHILDKSYYSLANPPSDVPAFPFAVGRYGTGANFAIRRSVLPKVGKFDTAFGAGSRTGGGEDIDFFTRIIFARKILVVQPNAVVWHRHRADEAALEVQAKAYGIGLGAWLTKLALSPSMWFPLLKKVTAGRRQLANLGEMDAPAAVDPTAVPLIAPELEDRIRTVERRAIILGPYRYFQQRLHNLRPSARPNRLGAVLSAYPLLVVGAIIAAAQAVLLIPDLPAAVRGVLLGIFIFTQPGMLSVYRMRTTVRMRAVLIAGISVSAALILPTFAAMSQLWYPQWTMLGLAALVLLGHAVAIIREVHKH